MMSSTLPTGPLDPSLLTTLFIILVPLSLLLLLLQVKRNSRGHPPCPPRLPLIGNLHQLGPLPHRSLHALSQQHGPLMLLRLGQVPVLVVSSPDAAREVLRNQDRACAGRPALKAARILLYGCKDLAFAPYGDYWKQLRKICSVHLLSPKRVQSYRLMREEEVESMMGKISSQASASANVIDLSEVLYSFTNDVLCRVVSGKFTREEGRNRLFSELVGENSALTSKIFVGDYIPWLGWLDMFFGSVARCNKNKARWDKLLDEVIKEHAVRSVQHGGEENDGEEKDFVDVLLSLQKDAAMDFALTTEDIKALLVDMFGAGTDTSYITLEWAMAELIRSPRAMRKLQDEVRRGRGSVEGLVREEEVSQMAYLKAVVKEVLRLHPPAPLLVPRELLEDCSIQGYSIPKKARVFVNAWSMGRDPRSWESPEEFRPERFADGTLDFTGNDARYVPFGAGRRICPGQNFAVAALELALANLVSRFDWELPGGLTREELQMNEAPGTTIQRQGRLHLVAKPWGA
ncbi:cytochrome P450 71A1-like [Musa acuminata AAA Group]|uniref:cytochrome P450 71A1-like n=1 Tax=Musa acuminata AAA Group TaxID=214697 RepID=UPI0031DEF0F7